ncbi:MAG: hypothetical protein P9L91_00440, partial [Candidatus Zophobacter franzmannii]|nr:hypothetical protein [Candidatus Zophobacter franzmannii]
DEAKASFPKIQYKPINARGKETTPSLRATPPKDGNLRNATPHPIFKSENRPLPTPALSSLGRRVLPRKALKARKRKRL